MEVKISYDSHKMKIWTNALETRAHMVAACAAIDQVARQSVQEGRDEMKAVFKKPTAYTLRAMTMKYTRNLIPLAFVGINENARYLDAQVKGGFRNRKRSEALLNSTLSPKRYFVPINPSVIKRAELIRVMSYLQSHHDQLQNTTDKSKRKSAYLKKVEYSVVKKGSKVSIFANEKTGSRWRRLIYSGASQPVYEKRLDVEGVVDAVMYTQFQSTYEKALTDYIDRKSGAV